MHIQQYIKIIQTEMREGYIG